MAQILQKRSVSRRRLFSVFLLTVLGVFPVNAEEPVVIRVPFGTGDAVQCVVQLTSEFQIDPAIPLTENQVAAAQVTSEIVQPKKSQPATDQREERLRGLDRPLGAVDFSQSREEMQAPPNLAKTLMTVESPLLVTASLGPVQAPNRYPIAAVHNPIYFEDLNLERCGIGYGCVQTAVSSAKFITRATILPYSMIARPWCTLECDRFDCSACGQVPYSAGSFASCDGFCSATSELCTNQSTSVQTSTPSNSGNCDE